MSKSVSAFTRLALASAFLAVTGTSAASADHASADEAVAMVGQGVAYIKANGTATGYAEITKGKDGRFRDRDLYLVVYGFDGMVHAHGANPRMVGKNLIDMRDVDGKAFVQERADLGRKNASFWQDYKFTNPVSRQIQPKKMYCESLEQTVVCGGIYSN